ncbi:MAG: helix-turn-helix transcriptional regulator [Candidatus Rokubacteria bacterium]|nr:helix-turn-helix transcriptional regulator [Candidatus Rokubacteria bacterium]MBI2879118.1 helix-turn-helix transcriptional regulator [Candidatus Rokubacteria bacterium]
MPPHLGKRLKVLRRRRGMTQAALAHRAGLSLGYLARLELGRHDPSLTTLRKLARALKMTVADLTG